MQLVTSLLSLVSPGTDNCLRTPDSTSRVLVFLDRARDRSFEIQTQHAWHEATKRFRQQVSSPIGPASVRGTTEVLTRTNKHVPTNHLRRRIAPPDGLAQRVGVGSVCLYIQVAL
jgi:hypothetical protein